MAVAEMKWTPEKIKRYWKTKYENDIPKGALYKTSDAPRAQHKFILEKIKEFIPFGKSVLDVGLGGGWLAGKLQDVGYVVSGIDIERFCGNSIDFKIGSFESIPFPDNSFDCVVSIDVIEHLTEAQFDAGLKECFRVLRKGGCILFGTDNGEELSLAKSLCPECLTVYHPCQHLTSWNKDRLKSKLKGLFEKVTFFEHRMGNGCNGELDTTIVLRRMFVRFGNILSPILRCFIPDPFNKLLVVAWKL